MVLWSSRDEGGTWTRMRNVTAQSALNHNYAHRPVAAHDPFFAFWADGNPRQLSESRLYFSDSTGTRGWRLPYTMSGDTAEPEPVKIN